MLIFSLLLMLLTFLYVKETPVSEKSGSILCELKNQVQKSLLYTRNSPGLRKLLFLSLCTGMVLFTVETYWQPALTTTFPQIKGWILGLLPFSGFFCTALGSQLGAVLLNRPSCRTQSRWWSVFFAGKFLLAASVVLFSFQQGLFLYACKIQSDLFCTWIWQRIGKCTFEPHSPQQHASQYSLPVLPDGSAWRSVVQYFCRIPHKLSAFFRFMVSWGRNSICGSSLLPYFFCSVDSVDSRQNSYRQGTVKNQQYWQRFYNCSTYGI